MPQPTFTLLRQEVLTEGDYDPNKWEQVQNEGQTADLVLSYSELQEMLRQFPAMGLVKLEQEHDGHPIWVAAVMDAPDHIVSRIFLTWKELL
jgi:hypothetical protein